MRRALYEWGLIFSCALFLVCFVYWTVSISTSAADFAFHLPIGHWNAMQFTAHRGTLAIYENPGSPEAIDIIIEKGLSFYPPPAGKYSFTVPGFRLRCVTWADRSADWTL